MNTLQLIIPKNTMEEVFRIFVPEDLPKGSELELIIRIQSENLTVREFGNYLSLLDRFYGRLYSEGIYAYAHRESEQLRFSEIRNGSIEVIIKEVIDNMISNRNLIILYFLMKYLPTIIKSSAEAVKNLAETYKYYEEATQIREERKNRKRLRESLKEDKHIQKLDSNRLEQIVKLLDALYAKEAKRLPQAIKTAKNKIEEIKIKIVKRK